LRARLGEEPSFVAYEGWDTVAVLAEALRTYGTGRADVVRAWEGGAVAGTRGEIRFSRRAETGVRQWAAPVQVAERDPAEPGRFRVLHQS
ncbi:ABC transporter substrate-binding protein, partial [Streptomyces sp. ZG43]